MRKYFFFFIFSLVPITCIAGVDIASSCQILFDDDKVKDLAVLVSSEKISNLYILIPKGSRVDKELVFEKTENMTLSCEKGSEIIETLAGENQKRKAKHKTNGYYIKLKQPEGASVAIFKIGNQVKKVWLED